MKEKLKWWWKEHGWFFAVIALWYIGIGAIGVIVGLFVVMK